MLLRGPSGAGKSDLALRLIDAGARLVADDQTALVRKGGILIATPPARIAGLIEARGVGIVRLARGQLLARAPVALLVDLVPPERIERLPEPARETPARHRPAGAGAGALRGLRPGEVATCLGANRGRMIGVASAMPDSPASSAATASRDTRRPFVVVTGLSGAGRVTALHALDDMGYVAVDNVPLPLLGDLMRSTAGSPGEMAAPLAFGVDTRTYGFDPHDLVRRLPSCASAPTSPRACCSSNATPKPCSAATPNRAGRIRWRPTGRWSTASSKSAARSAGCAIRPTS